MSITPKIIGWKFNATGNFMSIIGLFRPKFFQSFSIHWMELEQFICKTGKCKIYFFKSSKNRFPLYCTPFFGKLLVLKTGFQFRIVLLKNEWSYELFTFTVVCSVMLLSKPIFKLEKFSTTLILDRDVFEVCQSKKILSTVNVN